jgi:hypothetical protein
VTADQLQKLGAGFASGIGALGLIVFTGGLIQYLRFEAAGLPATEAVANTPRTELIVVGAQALASFLLVGGVVVVAAYLLDDKGGALWTLVCAGVAAVVGLGYAVLGTRTGFASVLILVFVALALLAVLFGVTQRTGERFLWVGAAIFLSVAMFGTASQYRINHDNPQVHPVAVLRGLRDNGITGVFVALSDRRLYIEQIPQDLRFRKTHPPGLYVFPCKDVSALAIGPFENPGKDGAATARHAGQLLDQLVAARNIGAGQPPDTPPSKEGAATKTTADRASIC